MNGCDDVRSFLTDGGAEDALARAAAEDHARGCALCRGLLRAAGLLAAAAERPEPPEEHLAEIRRAVAREVRRRTPARVPAWGLATTAATAALVLLAFAAGWRFGAAPGAARDPLARELVKAAALRPRTGDPLDSPLTFSNVRIEPAAGGRLRVGTEVSAHVDLSLASDDPVLHEVLAQALLAGGSPLGSRLRAVEVADRSPDPRVLLALLRALREDPSPAVRKKTIERLSTRAASPDVRAAFLDVLSSDPSVEIRLLALDALAGGGVDRGSLRRALDSADPATRPALLVRAAPYLEVR